MVLNGCSSNQMPKERPQDFAFVLKYGIEAKNELNTIDGTFTKDLVISGTKTIPLELSNDEITMIYDELRKISINSYPKEFKPDNNSTIKRSVTPCQSYDLFIRYNGKEHQISWIDSSLSEVSEAKNLRDLINVIISTIESKEEFKKLTEPQGGYL